MSNKVIAGDYENKTISSVAGNTFIILGLVKKVYLDNTTIEEYEIVDEEKRKSAASAVGRGLVGGLLLGPVGLLAGLSAKTKGTHVIAIQFKDGKKSLIQLDSHSYKAFLKKVF